MSRHKITPNGVWMVLWSAWHAAWIYGLVWVVRTGWPAPVDLFFRWLYTAFLLMEAVGVWDNANDPPEHRETIKTMSQFRQWVAQKGKPRSPDILGWKALGGGSGLIDAAVVGKMVAVAVGPVAGVVTGIVLALWLVPHYGWRSWVG